MEMYKCRDCGLTKWADHFYIFSKTKKPDPACKQCRIEHQKTRNPKKVATNENEVSIPRGWVVTGNGLHLTRLNNDGSATYILWYKRTLKMLHSASYR